MEYFKAYFREILALLKPERINYRAVEDPALSTRVRHNWLIVVGRPDDSRKVRLNGCRGLQEPLWHFDLVRSSMWTGVPLSN